MLGSRHLRSAPGGAQLDPTTGSAAAAEMAGEAQGRRFPEASSTIDNELALLTVGDGSRPALGVAIRDVRRSLRTARLVVANRGESEAGRKAYGTEPASSRPYVTAVV